MRSEPPADMSPEGLLADLRGETPEFDREGVVYRLGDRFPFDSAEIRYNFEPRGSELLQDEIDQFRGAPNLGHLYLDGEQVGPTDHRREEWERVMTERHCSTDEKKFDGTGSRLDEWKRFYERKDTTQAEKHEDSRN